MIKKIMVIILIFVSGLVLYAAGMKKPERPVNVPEGAERLGSKDEPYWLYTIINNHDVPFTTWYINGNPRLFRYKIDNNKFEIYEYYYENGNMKELKQYIEYSYLEVMFKKDEQLPIVKNFAGKQQLFYKNGKLKEERSYTPVLYKQGEVRCVLCGPEVFYDETGKETKRIAHNEKCEYGYDVIPRKSADELIAIVKPYKDKIKNDSLVRLPVVGKITSLDSSSKEIRIEYKTGFRLNVGDQICFIIESEIVSYECSNNETETGTYILKEDNKGKLPLVNITSEPHFYKKNEVRYTDVLKSGSKPKAGDIKVIAGIEFVFIPAGEYVEADDSHPDKVLRTNINAFWMTKYEVTLGEYLKYCYEKNIKLPENKASFTLDSRYPAALGKYHDRADGFCGWFGKKHGVKTELPEHFEWKYAARGGTTTRYYWGNGNINDYCWYTKNSGGKLHPVGQKKPNAFGLYDITGNAWEWCEDLHLRGGSCQSEEHDLQYSVSYMIHYDYLDDIGDKGYLIITNQGTGFRMIIRVP
ncbi:MAG TPA: SUMF1/EgtB/PvdO family nonheme iron enzyme [Spirochaetota bacterium]|nr:SUMF1/EgtB/PvdO family nonheme iron enzyme [Spirochaetota bacterium]